jgi:maltose/moltooligosaccharide transporter
MSRLNYGKTFLLGFGFFGVSVIWGVYNAFVPIFLSEKFGLAPAIVGIFMTLDNIAGFFIQPATSAWSDRVRSPLGRRIPFILIGAPISAVAFGLIPVAGILPLFVACTSTLLLSAAVWRAPVIALMPDITPSQFRSQANGVINFMGGIGAIIALQTGGILYKMSPNFPFWLGSALVILAALVVYLFIEEPKEYEAQQQEEQIASKQPVAEFIRKRILVFVLSLIVAALIGLGAGMISPEARSIGIQLGLPPYVGLSLILLFAWFMFVYTFYMAQEVIFDPDKNGLRLLLAIFFWFIGYSAVDTFFTLYAKNHLGLNEGDGATLLSVLPLFFVLFSVPSGFLAGKIGRRITISIGLVTISVMLFLLYVTPASALLTGIAPLPLVGIPLVEGGPRMLTLAGVFLMVMGVAWAFININSLPMVVDLTNAARIGTYTGLYYLFSTLSAIVGPILNGVAIQLTGNNFNIVMILAPISMLVALWLILGVKRGEAVAEG